MVKKGQAALEFALAFIIMAALIMGLVNLWAWSKNQLSARQSAYEASRVTAGSKDYSGNPTDYYNAKDVTDADIYLFK